MFKFLLKLFGDPNERALKAFRTTVNKINSLEQSFEQFTNDELPEKTIEFRDRFQRGEGLDSLLPEAFALVRESAKRTIGQRHYDTQLL